MQLHQYMHDHLPPLSRHDATPEIWQETYLSAILRAILYADDPNYSLQGFRKLDPITTPEGELRFLQVAETLFPKGWQLGSDPEIQVASIVSNHLTAGIMKYFGDSFRLDQAANLFEKIYNREPEVASLLAQSYIGMSRSCNSDPKEASLIYADLDAEVKGIQVIANALHDNPQSYTLLHVQCDFLRSKGKSDWAVKLARQAVNCAPSEFVTWAKLTEVYIELGMFESVRVTCAICLGDSLTCVRSGSLDIELMSYVHLQRARFAPNAYALKNTSSRQTIHRRLEHPGRVQPQRQRSMYITV